MITATPCTPPPRARWFSRSISSSISRGNRPPHHVVLRRVLVGLSEGYRCQGAAAFPITPRSPLTVPQRTEAVISLDYHREPRQPSGIILGEYDEDLAGLPSALSRASGSRRQCSEAKPDGFALARFLSSYTDLATTTSPRRHLPAALLLLPVEQRSRRCGATCWWLRARPKRCDEPLGGRARRGATQPTGVRFIRRPHDCRRLALISSPPLVMVVEFSVGFSLLGRQETSL